MSESAGDSPKRATYADVLAAPEHLLAEILDGELVLSRRPVPRFSRAAMKLLAALMGPFDDGKDGPGGWWLLRAPELHFGEDVVVPDVVGWRHERMPVIPDVPYLELAPDWACEVLSPSTVRWDRAVKTRIYAREGVSHLWLLDPVAELLEVLELRDGDWVLAQVFAGDEVVRARPFDAVELKMGRWWVPREEVERP